MRFLAGKCASCAYVGDLSLALCIYCLLLGRAFTGEQKTSKAKPGTDTTFVKGASDAVYVREAAFFSRWLRALAQIQSLFGINHNGIDRPRTDRQIKRRGRPRAAGGGGAALGPD
jgi:hypothetical protein